MTLFLAAIPGNVLDEAKRPLFALLVGFILTFLVVRLNTRLTRRHGRSHLRMPSVVTPGGLHIHHSVFGIIGMVVTGILAFALQPQSPWLEFLALVFGGAAALTLDEFALILHLEDVYWTGEGRKSIDAVILGLTFITLLLAGLLPRSIDQVGDYITISRWVGFVLILGGAVFVVVCYLKASSSWHRRHLRPSGGPDRGGASGQAGLAVGSPAVCRQPPQAGARPAPRRGLSPGVGAAQAPSLGRDRRQAAPAAAAS